MAETKEARSRSESKEVPGRQERDRGVLQRRDAGFANPFEFVDRMAEEMDDTFDRIFRDFGMPRRNSWVARRPLRSPSHDGLWSPRLETFQKEDRFVVRADLPGLKKDDVHVELTDDAITIRGERRAEQEEEREGYYRTEREYGQFYRSVPIPDGAIAESAQASFKDGVLEISMQAPPAESRARRLEIKDSSEHREQK